MDYTVTLSITYIGYSFCVNFFVIHPFIDSSIHPSIIPYMIYYYLGYDCNRHTNVTIYKCSYVLQENEQDGEFSNKRHDHKIRTNYGSSDNKECIINGNNSQFLINNNV